MSFQLPERKHYAQLAKNLEQIPAKKRDAMFPGYMSEKLDGVFMFAVCIGGRVWFFSRTGEVVLSPVGTQIESDIKQLHVDSWLDFVLIGEFWHPTLEQAEISGIFRKQQEGYAEGCQFHVHDKLTVDEFLAGCSEQTYARRLVSLTGLMAGPEKPAVKLVLQKRCRSAVEFIGFSDSIQKAGGEGGIYRPDSATYVAGDRSTNLVRIKQEISYDLEVLRVNEVKTGPKGGLLGSIAVRFRKFADPAGEVLPIDIRGMGHDDLRAWSEDPSRIVGKVVKVTAMRFTNLGSLREPRFKEVRFDKEQPDL